MSHKKIALICLLLIAFVMTGTVSAQQSGPIESRGYANPSALISSEELATLIAQDSVKVVDFRNMPGFITGHIPGAIQIGRSDLQDDTGKYNLFRVQPRSFADVMASKGIGNRDDVVAYDDQNGLWASRVWWMATMYGHAGSVRMLDGGLDRWRELGNDIRRLGSRTGTATYNTGRIDLSTNATIDDVIAAMDDDDTIILDVRSWAEYTGEQVASGAGRGGRVPGAVWVEWTKALNEDGTFKSADELRAIYADVGIDGTKTVIAYCQGGVRACHSTFVLYELLGYTNAKNYDGSWLEWSNEQVPIASGP